MALPAAIQKVVISLAQLLTYMPFLCSFIRLGTNLQFITPDDDPTIAYVINVQLIIQYQT